VLVIVASRTDSHAQLLAERWTTRDARLLTSRDLSTKGWSHRLDNGSAATAAVVNGCTIASEQITGVLTCVPAITEDELPNVVADDRPFVAAEMTALLIAWLSSLTCPVVNRPTPASLMGPGWYPEQWLRAASDVGIPTCPIRRRVRRNGEEPLASGQRDFVAVTVVGDAYFGDADPKLGDRARQLAKAAGVDLLTVHFLDRGPDARLATAELAVDISRPEIADAILEHFARGPRC